MLCSEVLEVGTPDARGSESTKLNYQQAQASKLQVIKDFGF